MLASDKIFGRSSSPSPQPHINDLTNNIFPTLQDKHKKLPNMSEIPTESKSAQAAVDSDGPATSVEQSIPVVLPAQWKYRSAKILGAKIPWYASPPVQLGMVSFVCFLCPGMFNALGGLGGGGKQDVTLADNMVSNSSFPLPLTKPRSFFNIT